MNNDSTQQLFSTLVANRSGGVGKTLLAQTLIALLSPSARGRWRPLSIDTFEVDQRSKLSQLFSESLDMPIAPNLGDVEESLASFNQVWDKVFLKIVGGDALVDFGANVAPRFARWLELQRGETFGVVCPPVLLAVPVTGSAQSLSDGVATIEAFWKTQRVLPIGRTIVFANELFGAVEKLPSADYAWLLSQARRGKLSILRMPKCDGPMLAVLDSQDVGVVEALDLSDAEFATRFGMRDLRALRQAQVQLADWLIVIGVELRKAGLVGVEAEKALA